MIFAESNYGRFEAMAVILAWEAVGAAFAIVLIDGTYILAHWTAGLYSYVKGALVAGALVWLLPLALARFREVGEIVRNDHSPIPKKLMIAVAALSLSIGAIAIVTHRLYLLDYFQRLRPPLPAVTAPFLSTSVLGSLAVSYAGVAAWFALFPTLSSARDF